MAQRRSARESVHTYLRLTPELRKRVWGPMAGDEPTPSGERHPVLRGFEETDILPFGAELEALKLDVGVTVPLTFIPSFPVFPPEVSWMREPKTNIPGLVLNQKGAARIAYLPAEIDSRYGRDHLPDHAQLLANIVRWAAGEHSLLEVQGPGLLDCHLYRQGDGLIFHVLNLSNEAAWKAPMEELIPVGPVHVGIKLPSGVPGHSVHSLVSSGPLTSTVAQGWVRFDLRAIVDHEVIVIR
jgi:hypothetical protein